jgi:threonine aldolase
MLVGSAERWRGRAFTAQALGGGMRQAGMLAAAGLIALQEGPNGSGEDHANARLLAESLAHTEGVAIDLATVETNIVVFRLQAGKGAAELAARLKARGVLVGAFGPDAIRVVTHRDVSRKDCIDAAEALTEEIEAGIKTASIK